MLGTPPPPDPEAAALPGLERWLARPRNERLALVLLVAVAFLLRLAHVLASRACPLFEAPQMDALYHVEWAHALAAGREFQDGPYFRAPLYPWFLGALFAVFGDGLLLPRAVQAGLGALSCLLTWGLARAVFDRSTGLVAGALLACHWVTIFYDGELLLEVLATPLYLAALLATLGFLHDARPRRGLGAGLLFGLSAICRPNVLLYLPLLALYLARTRRLPLAGAARARAVALFCAGVALPIAPVTAINLAEGDTVLISYQAGVNLWIGNHPGSDGSSAIAPGTRPDWWGGFEDTHAQAEAAEGRPLRPSEVSRHYVRRTLDAIGEDPGRWLRLLGFKLRLFLMDWELGNNEEPRFLMERYSPLLAALPPSFGALLGLAAVGLALARRGRGPHLPVIGFALVYSASVVLFFVNARFRLPVVPLLAVYAAGGALAILGLARARRPAPALGAAACALGIALASRALVPAVVPRNGASNGRLILGQAALRAGDLEQAGTLLDQALELWPRSPVALEALASTAHAWFQAGEHARAAAAFQRVASARPRDFDASFSLGRAELEAGNRERALAAFERALELPEPAEERFLYEAYGRAVALREERGEPGRALELAERMLRRFPADPTVRAVTERLRATAPPGDGSGDGSGDGAGDG